MIWVILGILAIALAVVGVRVWGKRDRQKTTQPSIALTVVTKPTAVSLTPSSVSDVELNSEVGADYRRLRDLLAVKRYRDADEETYRVMLWVACREPTGYLNDDAIATFPCQDLQTIDRLWLHYSDRRFGFSIQKQIYEAVQQDYNRFAERVGWCINRKWKRYRELIFDRSAPKGQFPARISGRRWVVVMGCGSGWILFSRVQQCGF
jgi:hypothetical protein